jgi:hypothetical protein
MRAQVRISQIVPESTKNIIVATTMKIEIASEPTALASKVQLSRRKKGNVGITINNDSPITIK